MNEEKVVAELRLKCVYCGKEFDGKVTHCEYEWSNWINFCPHCGEANMESELEILSENWLDD